MGDKTGTGRIPDSPDQVSRFFFGGNGKEQAYQNQQYGPPPSYGPPSYNPNQPAYDPYYPNGGGINNIFLTNQLGQAALIVFMIAAIVFVLFLLMMACLFCTGHIGGRRRETQVVTTTAPYNQDYSGASRVASRSTEDRERAV